MKMIIKENGRIMPDISFLQFEQAYSERPTHYRSKIAMNAIIKYSTFY